MKKMFVILLALTLASCASQTLKNPAIPEENAQQSGVEVSSEIIQDLSDEHNVLLQINFRNRTGRWVRIDSAQLDLTDDLNTPYNVIVGKDLTTWAAAKEEEKAIHRHNENTGILAAVAGGTSLMILGAVSKNRNLMDAGGVTVVGATSYGAVKDVIRLKEQAQGVVQVPDTHLYAPFMIPSMSFTKRWILVNLPTGRGSRLGKLNLRTIEGDTYTYYLKTVN